MKNVFGTGGIALLIILSIFSCKKDVVPLDTSLTAVSSLNAPADGASIQLQPATGASIVFQWSAASTPDSGLILYEVAFDKGDGDFSQPIFKLLSDGSGMQTQATIAQKDLNKIAALAGIASSSSGNIKWAVIASKATNKVISTVTQ